MKDIILFFSERPSAISIVIGLILVIVGIVICFKYYLKRGIDIADNKFSNIMVFFLVGLLVIFFGIIQIPSV